MAQYQSLPWEQHLMALRHIFAYIQKHPVSRIVFDTTNPYCSGKEFVEVDWEELHHNVVYPIPPHASEIWVRAI